MDTEGYRGAYPGNISFTCHETWQKIYPRVERYFSMTLKHIATEKRPFNPINEVSATNSLPPSSPISPDCMFCFLRLKHINERGIPEEHRVRPTTLDKSKLPMKTDP